VRSDGVYRGIIPGWGTGDLISLVAALVLTNETITFEDQTLAGTVNVSYEQFNITIVSLQEHTSQVSATGLIHLSLPPIVNGSHYRVFSFYQKQTDNRNLVFNSSRHENIFDDGSYVVDHFDAKGADTVANFWQEHILKDGVLELVKSAGHFGTY
jgi:hypothetical protein